MEMALLGSWRPMGTFGEIPQAVACSSNFLFQVAEILVDAKSDLNQCLGTGHFEQGSLKLSVLGGNQTNSKPTW